jgi:hypothetical protein
VISSQSPVPIRSPIFGPAYMSRAGNLADQECINLYAEVVETKTGKEIGALYGTPGLTLQATLGNGPIRGMHVANLATGAPNTVSAGPLLYAVSDTSLYSLDSSFNQTFLGSGIGTDPGQTGGQGGYLWSLQNIQPGFSIISLPFTPTNSDTFVTMADNGFDLAVFVGMTIAQLDGFGLINQPGTYNFFQSNEVDFSNWPALQFAQASGDPDNISALIQTRREIFVLKQVNSEVWNNVGTPNFTFAREQGPYMEGGCLSPASLAKLGETFFFLAKNRQGESIVVKLIGYNFQRVSTHAIEREIQSWPDKGASAVGFSYQQEGHVFYVLSSTLGDQTWVYDDTTSALAGVPMWHQREAYDPNPSVLTRHWANNSVSFAGLNLVGDYRNGNIYSYDLNNYTDNGNQKIWTRSYRALPQRTGKIVKFYSLSLDMETGIGVPAGANPQVQLTWSDDGGHTWGPILMRAAGATGATSQRVKFNRLGALKAADGYDRIFKISSSDQFQAAIIGSLIETGQ